MNAKKIKKPPAKKVKAKVAIKPSLKPQKKEKAMKPDVEIVPKKTAKPVAKVATIIAQPEIESEPIATKLKPKTTKKKRFEDDLPMDLEEREDLFDEEKRDLAKALSNDDDDTLDTSFVPTDTSERYILVVDEEGQRRNETVTIISQILPNAVIEIADDPEEALEIMQDCDFDTYVVNFLMPGFSASTFVKTVANHPAHSLLIGFAADKISDAIDPKKGLKIIPLKRLFDLETNIGGESSQGEGAEG